MKITKQEKTGNKVKLEIEEDYNHFKAMMERVWAEAASDINIPGFRKGKAPRQIIEQYLDKGFVVERAAQNLVSDLYPEIIKAANIEPVDYPNVVILSQEEGKPFGFAVEVDVYPEVKLGKYKGVAVESEKEELTEKEADQFMNDLRGRFAKYIEVTDRGIEDEDLVELDLLAATELGDVKSLSGRKVTIEVGRGQIAHEFDKEIKGLSLGQKKEFSVKFGEEHPAKEIAGRSVKFTVTPSRISKKELPPLDENFAKEIANAPSIEAFKEDVKKRLAEDKKLRVEGEIKNKLIEKVAGDISADIPGGMIDREIDVMVDELKGSLLRDKLTLEEYLKMTRKSETGLRDELKGGATMRVKSKLALRAIALKEKIILSDKDVSDEIGVLARSSGENPENFRGNIGGSGLEYIKDYLLRRKALDHIMAGAKISYK